MKYIAGEQLQYTAMNTLKSKVLRKKWCDLKAGKAVDFGESKIDELLERRLVIKQEKKNGN